MKFFHSYTYRVANGFGDFASLSPVSVSAFAAEGERGSTVPIRAGVDGTAKLSETFQLYRRLKALIISIDNYTNGWPGLSMAVEDARQVAASLKKQGFGITL